MLIERHACYGPSVIWGLQKDTQKTILDAAELSRPPSVEIA